MSEAEAEFAADMLCGAEEIAQFLFGNRDERRKIYHLAATSHLPTFKLGSMICARRSILLRWIEQQEQRNPPANSSREDAERKDWNPSGLKRRHR